MNNVKTTKKDTVNHGYGIKNIKEILNKYESVYDAEQDGNMFKTKMCIFM
jgi:sensor histidine kinase YesM